MSHTIDRLLVSRGPAMITHRGGVFFSKGDITAELMKETKEVESSAFGELDQINTGIKATLKFTPVGEFEHLDVLYPYGTTVPGTSIFGDEDHPVLIQPLDDGQRQVTFHAGGVSKMPDLNFTAQDTLMAECELQMVGANGVAVDNANRLFTFAANVIDLAALPYDPDKLIIQAYSNSWTSAGGFTLTFGANTTGVIPFAADAATVQAALRALASSIALNVDPTVTGSQAAGWTITFGAADGNVGQVTAAVSGLPGGSSIATTTTTAGVTGVTAEVQKVTLTLPWLSWQAREGVKVAFSLDLGEQKSDAIGHYDTIFKKLTVKATAMPQGMNDEIALLAAELQGARAVVGRKMSTGAHDLIITGDGVYFALYGANIGKSPLTWGSEAQRTGELEWSATRGVLSGGILRPLFYLGDSAPA